MTLAPRHTSPSYNTNACPGVMARAGWENRTWWQGNRCDENHWTFFLVTFSSKIGGSKIVTFFWLAHFSYDMKHGISTRWSVYPNWGCSHFPQCLELVWLSLFIIQEKILVLIDWSYTSPQLYWLLSLEQLSYFEHIVQSLLHTSL
jgi:hypothetical protein